MRKKIFLSLTFVLAFVVSLAVLVGISGCKKGGNNKDEVTVNISRATLTLETGKTGKLTAAATDGSELVWTTSNEEVATVDAGTVTGVKAGTATVTATVKGGTASASCEVTVKDPVVITIKDASGAAVTEVTVDRNGAPVQLSATASDGSEITVWSVAGKETSDNKVYASVTDGLVTGLKEGEAVLTAMSATGSASIDLHVIDTAPHTAIIEGAANAKAGEWWYYASSAQNRSPEILTNEVRGGEVAFEFGGNCNWNVGDVQLGLKKDSTAKLGWAKLSGKITSSVDGTINIFDTAVAVKTGENTFTVYYDQANNENCVYITPHNDISAGKFVIVLSDLKWEDHTVQTLTAPSFTLSGDTVTITDTNTEGVKDYQIGFFNAEGTLVASQSFAEKTGTLNASTIEINGTYTLKVRATALSGFTVSEWSEHTEEYEVNNAVVSYDLERTTAVSDTHWTYYTVHEDSVGDAEVAKYENGVVTFEIAWLGWKYDSTQMSRHYPQFNAGTPVKVSMKIESNQAGRITISGTVIALEEGVNEFDIFTTQPASGATVSIMFGEQTPDGISGMDWEGEVAFKIQVVSVADYTPQPLATPSASYATEGKVITVDGDYADKDLVANYQVGFFDGDTLAGYTAIASDGTFSDLAIANGSYTLKVRAVPKTAEYVNSGWSEAIATDYVVENSVTITQLSNGGEHESYIDPGKWYEWHDQGWNGSNVTLGDAYTTNNGEVHFGFTISGANWYNEAAHLYYHDAGLTAGAAHRLTLKINSTVACDIVVNDETVSLTAGDNNVSVNFIHPEENLDWQNLPKGATIRIYFNNNGSFVLSDVQVVPVTQTKLSTPSIAFDELNYTITDTENTQENSVSGYKISIYNESGKLATSTTVTAKTGTLNVSLLETGTYTVKVTAIGTILYIDSDESEAVTLNVVNEGGIVYEMPFGQAADDQWGNKGLDVDGKYYYWNDQNWAGATVTMSQKSYENGTITLGYTVTAGGTDFAVQVFRKANDLTAGSKYTLTFNINVAVATKISVNGTDKTLVAGDNNVSVEFTAPTCTQPGGDCVFAMQIHASTADNTAVNTVVISDIAYTPVA